ncbi:MAG: hypothetical protein JWM79_3152, partial [Nocardioides sp.]|nr:hypothetical protein [Nocardioides sp.]
MVDVFRVSRRLTSINLLGLLNHMTSIVRSVLVGLGATLALVVVPQPAHADQATLLDATGDSWASHPSGDWTQGSFANTDLRRTRVMHQHRRVVLDFTYVDLKAGASDEINLHAYLVTDKHVRYLVEVSVDYLGRSAHFG